jgi:flagellar basal body-associated protein FliL
MADEEAKPDSSDAPSGGAKRKKPIVIIGVFGAVMVVEGLAIFLCMKFLGSDPDPTQGLQGLQPTTQPWKESQELEVAALRVLNSNGPRTLLYNVRVVVRVHHSNQKKMEDFLKNRSSTIEDAMSRVVRSAEERHLAEPGLETLRRQLLYELNSLLGDDTIIEQVLIPGFTPLPTGF